MNEARSSSGLHLKGFSIHHQIISIAEELNEFYFLIFFFPLCFQVTVAHINATAKNAADDKLRQSLRRFAETHAAPATVVLVSCKSETDW